jgi:PmbA protein
MSDLDLPLQSTDAWLGLSNDILAYAKKSGADQAAISMDVEWGFDVAVRNRDLEQLTYHDSRSANILIYKNKALGHVVITDFRKEALCEAVDRAVVLADRLSPDQYNGLAEKEYLAFAYPNLSLYHKWNLEPQDAISKALEVEAYALDLDERIHLTQSCSVASVSELNIYANTNGFVGHYPSSHHSVSLSLVAKDSNGMQIDYDYSANCDASKLSNLQNIATNAVTNTVKRLSPRSLPTGTYPIIFAARVAKSLVRHFLSAISGSALYREQTFLKDAIGKKVFPDFVHIDQSPHLLGEFGSVPFDNEGVKTSHRDFIVDGILQSYILGSYSARRLGLVTTGNNSGAQNVKLQPGDKSLAALCKEMGRGLVVTDLLGQGVSILTGNYSRGAFAYYVENGEIQYPVEGITLAGNLQDIFSNIIAVGNDIDKRGSVWSPSIFVGDMMVAGE